MTKQNRQLNWLPALIMMGVIFFVSSQPSTTLPNFDWADELIKKSSHVTEYALLGISYWYGLGMNKNRRWLAWLLAILYALTDEYHQSFVAGRHSTIWDVVIFDNIGTLIGLWVSTRFKNRNDQANLPDR